MSRKILACLAGMCLMSLSIIAQPVLTVSSANASVGDTVDINIVADDYTNYISLQFSVNWDPGVVEYLEAVDFTGGLPGFNAATGVNPDVANGTLTVSWNDVSVHTLPDGTSLFTMRFEVIGTPCSIVEITDTPLEIEIADEDENNVGATVVNGAVNVDGGECITTVFEINGSQETGGNGEQVCVAFTTTGFQNIASATFTVFYDTDVLDFVSVENINWPGASQAGNFNELQPGRINFSWIDQNTTGVDVPDGTVLFELCFTIIGSGGQSSDVTISGGTPPLLPLEIADSDQVVLDVELIPGNVTVTGAVEGFTLISEDGLEANTGEEVCIDFSVNDFEDLISMQFSINWDSTILEFVRVENLGLDMIDVIGPEAAGNNASQATVVWFDQTISGVTLPDGSVIFTVCFNVLGMPCESTLIEFSDVPSEIEVSNLDEEIDVNTSEGEFTVTCGCSAGPVQVVQPCPGQCNGSIDIFVNGCAEPVSYMWSNENTTQDLTGLCEGEYQVTISTDDNQIIILDVIVLEESDPMTVNANITDVTNGGDGAIMITVGGGTSPYTFLWDDPAMSTTQNISGLDAGQYSVTVTDANGCTFAAGPFVVGDEGGALSGVVTGVACFGDETGVIDLTVNDCGPEPYTFAWSSGDDSEDVSGLGAGTWTVTVTSDDGSTCEASFEIPGPDSPLEVEVDTMNETGAGNDGVIDLTVSGGQGPYGFVWDDGPMSQDRTNLTAGSYTVTITDGLGCELVETILIRGNALFVDIIISDYNDYGVSCFNECDGELIAMVTNGVGAISYAWDNGETTQAIGDLCADAYTVTITDEVGGEVVATATVSQPPQLSVDLDVTCVSQPGLSDGAVTTDVSGGAAPYSYQWGGGETTPDISNQSSGPGVLFVTDANNCENMRQFEVCIEGIPCYQAISVITPNEDSKNDRFIIQCVFDFPNRLSIFNRYGGLEFQMDNYNNTWEGTDMEGNDLSDGGYLWVLEVFLNNGDSRVYKGTVALVRSVD